MPSRALHGPQKTQIEATRTICDYISGFSASGVLFTTTTRFPDQLVTIALPSGSVPTQHAEPYPSHPRCGNLRSPGDAPEARLASMTLLAPRVVRAGSSSIHSIVSIRSKTNYIGRTYSCTSRYLPGYGVCSPRISSPAPHHHHLALNSIQIFAKKKNTPKKRKERKNSDRLRTRGFACLFQSSMYCRSHASRRKTSQQKKSHHCGHRMGRSYPFDGPR